MKVSRLKFIESKGKNKYNKAIALYSCNCGNQKIIEITHVENLRTVSCGCANNKGKKSVLELNPLYDVYRDMIKRCTDINSKDYSNYGGRGIKVCNKWLESINNFLLDMGERPRNYTLDRINNNGNYEKSNCRWASRKQQNRNRRNTKLVELNGIVKPLTEWCEELNLDSNTIWARLNLGWSTEEALSKGKRKRNNHDKDN